MSDWDQMNRLQYPLDDLFVVAKFYFLLIMTLSVPPDGISSRPVGKMRCLSMDRQTDKGECVRPWGDRVAD